MLELNGELITAKSIDENTAELIDYVNTYCEENNITNDEGEVIYIESNKASPLYLMFQSLGYFTNTLQNLLVSAASSISIGESSDLQLLNIANIAGISRKNATKTTMVVVIYASEDTDCSITTDLTVTVSTTSGSVVFNPAYDVTIEANTAQYMILIATSYGAYNISANTVSNFDDNPEGFSSMVNSVSVPGQDQESIASLRKRIANRSEEKTWVSKIEETIMALDGISWCSVYYNSTNNAVTVGDTSVPSRYCLLTIQGYSDNIAQTYLQYACAPTAGEDSERVLSQNYTLNIGQTLTIYFLTPRYVSPYIQIFLSTLPIEADQTTLKETIALLAQTISIGQGLTSVDVINQIQDNTDYTVNGVLLSLDGKNYTYQVGVESDQLLVFDISLMTILES